MFQIKKRYFAAILTFIMTVTTCLSSFPVYAEDEEYGLYVEYGESAVAAGVTIEQTINYIYSADTSISILTTDHKYDTPTNMQIINKEFLENHSAINDNFPLFVGTKAAINPYERFVIKEYDSEKYDFVGWKYTINSGEQIDVPADSDVNFADAYSKGSVDAYYDYFYLEDENTIFIRLRLLNTVDESNYAEMKGVYTVEPIFQAKQPESTYTVSLYSENDEVKGCSDVDVEVIVSGADYDAISAEVTYDTDLFTFKEVSGGITADTSEEGTVKITGTSLNKSDSDTAATITFTANNPTEDTVGTFALNSARVGTSETALGEDAEAAAQGDPIEVTVVQNPNATHTVTFPDGTTVTVGDGKDCIFTLKDVYPVEDGYTYTVTAGDITCDNNNDGTYTIPNVTADVAVKVKASAEGTLTTDTLAAGATTYRVAVFKGTAPEGKTYYYGGAQMMYSSVYGGYVYIIGSGSEMAMASEVTLDTGDRIDVNYDGDVNQTGVIDINDAQLVSDLYNGTYTDGFETVSMIKWLAADKNGTKDISAADIAAIVSAEGFAY